MADVKKFAKLAVEAGAYSSPENLITMCKRMFDGVDLEGKDLLDVGGGVGLLTIYAASVGANATCIEPEGDGSRSGMRDWFDRIKNALDPKMSATFESKTVEAYIENNDKTFDVIVIANAINHINERAVEKLHSSEEAQRVYVDILTKLRSVIKPGGLVIITDCSRRNFFGDMGLKSPVMRTIEWHKHQTPNTWRSVFAKSGFAFVSLVWSSPNRFGKVGRFLLGNKVASYFLFSHFRMVFKIK